MLFVYSVENERNLFFSYVIKINIIIYVMQYYAIIRIIKRIF